MFNLPLHPIIVHFPIALAFVIPVMMVVFHFAYKTDGLNRRNWLPILVLSFLCTAGTAAAIWSGEQDEEKVEASVGQEAFEEHEEAGEWARNIAIVTFILALAVFYRPNMKPLAYLFFAASLVLAATVARSGHTGGGLVYKHGAAKAHLPSP